MENTGDNRAKLQNAADVCGLIFFGLLVLSGFVLYGAMPAQARRLGLAPGAAIRRLWGLTNGQWLSLHYKSAVLLIVSLVPNLYFGWPKRSRQSNPFTVRFVAGAIAFISVFAVIAHWMGAGEPDWASIQEQAGPSIMDDPLLTLNMQEIQTRLGVPPDHLREQLHMPPDATSNIPMLELMRRYSFTPEDMRRAILSYGRPAAPRPQDVQQSHPQDKTSAP